MPISITYYLSFDYIFLHKLAIILSVCVATHFFLDLKKGVVVAIINEMKIQG